MGLDTEIRRFRGFGDTNYVAWGQGRAGAGSAGAGAPPLPEAEFRFDSAGAPDAAWSVKKFRAIEGLSRVYEVTIELAAHDLAASPDALLGQYAVLQVARAGVARRFYGVARRVEHLGTTGSERLARVHLVPQLWVLSQRSDARIFQDMTAPDIVAAVLQEAGLYVRRVERELRGTYARRELCVQYRETDLAFVQRLLEEEGITYFFRHERDAEALVLSDSDGAWSPLTTMDGGPVPIAGPEQATHAVETVRHLRWEQEVRSTGVVVRDFDFTRPDWRVEQQSPRDVGGRALYEPAPAVVMGGYRDGQYRADDTQHRADVRIEAEVATANAGSGDGVVIGMIPGAAFEVSVAGAHVPEQRYVLIEVEHEGEAHEVVMLPTQLAGMAGEERRERYSNRFRCVPAEVPWRPARVTPRPTVSGMQTATVVGPAGEEIYTDEHGRIRVQFHWDRRGARDERSTCWVRVIQGPWAGNGWGFQFIPRIGMEVAVSFVEGDVDRPVVTGALYNGRNRPPYGLPEEKTRSGVRTESSPGGGGHNELRFEDMAGSEEVFLHAQRDMNEVVENDHTLRVGHDESIAVTGNQTQVVSGWRHEHVSGDQSSHVGGSWHVEVHDSLSTQVRGDQSQHAEGNHRVSVGGDADGYYAQGLSTRVVGRVRREVGGSSDEVVHDDHTVRVRGHCVTVVGRCESKRSSLLHVEGNSSFYSSETTEVESERDIVLRCGKSMLRLTPERLEIIAPEVIVRGGESRVTVGGDQVRIRAKTDVILGGQKLTMKSNGAAVKLDSNASVMGGAVKLGPGSIPLDDDPDDPVKVTTIELKDEDGRAVPDQRFVVILADGSEQCGFLNREGKATVEIAEDAEVTFPDLDEVHP